MKARAEVISLGHHKQALAQAMADALLDGVELPRNWRARLEAVDSPAQLRDLQGELLHEIAERNRAEAEEYRRTGRRPERLAARGGDGP